MFEHAEDCVADPPHFPDCDPGLGVWNQPQSHYVDEARAELGDDAPWCQVHHLAWDLQESDEAVS
jgi:hypothetical protein